MTKHVLRLITNEHFSLCFHFCYKSPYNQLDLWLNLPSFLNTKGRDSFTDRLAFFIGDIEHHENFTDPVKMSFLRILWNLKLGINHVAVEGVVSKRADLPGSRRYISVPSSLFKLASAWGKIYCVTCLTNYRREVASRDHLLKQPLLFAQRPLKRSTPCTTVHLHYMRWS